MNKENRNAEDQNLYRTGDTRHQEIHRGTLSVLLVVAIFLGGVATASSLLNIRLFKAFTKADSATVSLRFSSVRSATESNEASTDAQPQLAFYGEQDLVTGIPVLGATVQQLSAFDQLYYRLPSGLYVTKVEPNTPAAKNGLVPGDILISLDDQRLTDTDTLQRLLFDHRPGDLVKLVLYRSGNQHSVELTLDARK